MTPAAPLAGGDEGGLRPGFPGGGGRVTNSGLAGADQAIARAEIVVTLQTNIVECLAAADRPTDRARALLARMEANLAALHGFRVRLLQRPAAVGRDPPPHANLGPCPASSAATSSASTTARATR